jgi:hypothetical protein
MTITDGREYVSFYDPTTNARFAFDVTFLLSTYNCTWGNGCTGMTSVAEHGCCIKGVTLDGDAEVNRVTQWVEELTPDLWSNYSKYHADGDWIEETDDPEGASHNTTVLNGVCVFHNPEDSDQPTGCALHHLATRNNLDPDHVRPDACSIYPIQASWSDELTTIEPITRQSGSCMADEGNNWWCIDDPRNYDNTHDYFYVQYWDTLIRMTSKAVMDQFNEYALERIKSLPADYGHPANAGNDETKWGYFSTVPVTLTRKAE